MEHYQRAIETLNYKPTDRVATWGGWIRNPQFFESLTGKKFWKNPRAVAIEAYKKIGVDMVLEKMLLPSKTNEWQQQKKVADKYKTPGDMVKKIRSLPDIKAIRQKYNVDHFYPKLKAEIAKFEAEFGKDILVIPQCGSTKFALYIDYGYTNYFTAIKRYPEEIIKAYDVFTEITRGMNEAWRKLIEEGKMTPYFYTGWDICDQRGPMVSPEFLKSIYFPRLRRSLEPLVEIGARIIWHSDGYIINLIDELLKCGINGFQGFQENLGFDIGEVAEKMKKAGKIPLFLAGVNVNETLPFGKEEDVKKEVKRIIDTVTAADGYLAMGTANTAEDDCPVENLETLYRFTQEYQYR